ncbi:beta-N-acetylhexosaminidase [Gilliamella sp. B2776]|uniref:beta-N-acetylhexosaminidase n=1 Tax=unclassified Gilliamella TaxID=2685620 RepID=UPI00226A0AF0|nr:MULTISPECIES: beta-N-acetylhexosaminidase [unclassified Gilliamella]MCX8649087.1 beta-N-acetylhexosaminidase [Gilliamella sp. B2779]MCX8653037.1 beta-N-acetylhexosaminidase [Gilliamella sp. B2737]MCX8690899.1 beta-N-acetylhexosaminidase [Gilliamella sp. B2776]MCX8702057.1 beta-N-acetylhexosaminidase [Gilliamella sp. B2781]WDM18109.1 beta-N-acetylhexosaminidase [Gilliamella sp. B3022]
MGPLLIDLDGISLTDDDKRLLQNPLVAGVILFSRNYQEPKQLSELIKQIRAASSERLLISVDHEGGRVQRFKQGFTLIPPAQAFAALNDIEHAKSLAFDAGWVLAMELIAFDIDLSFAPVLDLGHDCLAIGSRSFHSDINIAYQIASAMIDGMHVAGMKTTGKHFPGHGHVIADSHKETPIDDRKKLLIEQDMQIFSKLIMDNQLDAIMPAHVIYPAFDDKPASGSSYWLKTVLRKQLHFKGVIFSDDLSMEGASVMGNHAQRAQAALAAGCDLLLACNNRQGSLAILKQLMFLNKIQPLATNKAKLLLSETKITFDELTKSLEWRHRRDKLTKLNEKWVDYASSNH